MLMLLTRGQQIDSLRARREQLAVETAALRSKEPPPAAEMLQLLETSAETTALPEEVRRQQQAEVKAAEAALHQVSAHRREQEELMTAATRQLCEDVSFVTECVQARQAREHAALRKEWEQMLPKALDEWRYLDERLHAAQKKLRSVFDAVEALEM